MNIGAIGIPSVNELNTQQKAGAGVLGAAASTAGILYAAKKGKLNPNEGGNLIVEGTKKLAKGYADNVNKLAESIGKITEKFLEKHAKLRGAVNFVEEKATAAKTFTGEKVQQAREFVGGKIESLGSKVKGTQAEPEYYI